MNEQELKQEAERKYPGEDPITYLQRRAWVVGALSRSGGVWVNFPNYPPPDKEVIFDGEEQPPIWGNIHWNGKYPSIHCYDSSGEDEYVDIKNYNRWLDESPAADKADAIDGWIEFKEGQPLPDYDIPVLWLTEDGNYYVESLDKDGNPWIFPKEREGTDWPDYPKVTHWRPLPQPPQSK